MNFRAWKDCLVDGKRCLASTTSQSSISHTRSFWTPIHSQEGFGQTASPMSVPRRFLRLKRAWFESSMRLKCCMWWSKADQSTAVADTWLQSTAPVDMRARQLEDLDRKEGQQEIKTRLAVNLDREQHTIVWGVNVMTCVTKYYISNLILIWNSVSHVPFH